MLDPINDFEGALDFYHEALRINPFDIDVHIKQGKSFEKIRNFDEACNSYKRALKIDKNHFEGLLNLGLV